MQPNTLEETLNGGYPGLFAEVVTDDIYRLRALQDEGWSPDIIFDLGANIGVFTRHARSIFPSAKIIAVEPHKDNVVQFVKFTSDPRVVLIHAAIGHGKTWHYLHSANGAMQVYVSEGLGYPAGHLKELQDAGEVEHATEIPTISVAELVHLYWQPGDRGLVKIDIEGGENAIFSDPASMDVLRQMDYIAMEVHTYAINGEEHQAVTRETAAALASFADTHTCELLGVNFYARKK